MKNWLNYKTITKTIDGKEVVFRRVPVGTLQKFRFMADDVSKALALLFKDTSKDVKVEQMSTPSEKQDAEGNAIMTTQYIQDASVPANIALRKSQLEEGIKGVVRSVMADESLEVLSEIIVKSASEEFNDSDIPLIKDQMDAATMFEFLKGAFEASAGDYSELGKSLFRKIPKLEEMVTEATGK